MPYDSEVRSDAQKSRRIHARSVRLVLHFIPESVRAVRRRDHVPTKRRVGSCRPSDQSAHATGRDVTRRRSHASLALGDVNVREVSRLQQRRRCCSAVVARHDSSSAHEKSILERNRIVYVQVFVFGSRPSDHYFRSVCWFVCLFVCLFVQSFSQPSLIRFRSNLDIRYMSESSCVP